MWNSFLGKMMNGIKILLLLSLNMWLTGCVGFSSYIEMDVVRDRDLEGESNGNVFVYVGSTKAQILAREGKPDSYGLFSNNKWIYEYGFNGEWCGVVPFVIVPIPLILPICNEGDVQFTFKNDVVIKHTVTRVRETDFICSPFLLLYGDLCGR